MHGLQHKPSRIPHILHQVIKPERTNEQSIFHRIVPPSQACLVRAEGVAALVLRVDVMRRTEHVLEPVVDVAVVGKLWPQPHYLLAFPCTLQNKHRRTGSARPFEHQRPYWVLRCIAETGRKQATNIRNARGTAPRHRTLKMVTHQKPSSHAASTIIAPIGTLHAQKCSHSFTSCTTISQPCLHWYL